MYLTLTIYRGICIYIYNPPQRQVEPNARSWAHIFGNSISESHKEDDIIFKLNFGWIEHIHSIVHSDTLPEEEREHCVLSNRRWTGRPRITSAVLTVILWQRHCEKPLLSWAGHWLKNNNSSTSTKWVLQTIPCKINKSLHFPLQIFQNKIIELKTKRFSPQKC